jgi:hypothetical protein
MSAVMVRGSRLTPAIGNPARQAITTPWMNQGVPGTKPAKKSNGRYAAALTDPYIAI